MKRVWSAAFALMLVLMMAGPTYSAVQPVVVGVDVTGNQEVVSDHILGVIGTKAGDQFNPEQVQQDIDTIYGLGFFSFVDVSVIEQFGGVFVEYKVQENPIVRDINFTGNTVFTADQLMEVVFTRPGSVFNRTFFRHDLQRIGEKYEKAGYAFVQVQDVGIQDGAIDVRILEPKVGDVIIQGNKKTKTHVIEREFNLKTGDLLNATILRHSLKKLNQLGFLEDVRVGFEPTPDPEIVNIVLTVEEGKSSRISLSVGHGSESGWSGGAAWEELNYRGLGHIIGIGFEMGDREQYWLQYRSPYMDEHTYAWEAGLYSYEWKDLVDYTDDVLNVTYDQDKRGIYAGIGKKFRHNPTLSWFLKADYHEVEFYNVRKEPGKDFPPKKGLSGTNYSVTGTLTRNLLDPYLSYPKGQVQSLSVEYGIFEPTDPGIEDSNYTKYWLEWRYYLPLLPSSRIFWTGRSAPRTTPSYSPPGSGLATPRGICPTQSSSPLEGPGHSEVTGMSISKGARWPWPTSNSESRSRKHFPLWPSMISGWPATNRPSPTSRAATASASVSKPPWGI